MRPTTFNLLRTLLAGFLAVATLPGTARAWWNDEWTMRKKITIDTSEKGAAIGEPIGGTPVLFRLFDGNFQFSSAKDDGGDLRFIAGDDKTPLKYHIEKWDGLMGEAFVWVNVPDLKPSAQTSIWIYFGNSGAKAVRADDPKGTYDADTTLVYHFGEKNQPANDFTADSITALNPGIPVEGSMIGGGMRLGGTNVINLPAAPALAWAEGASLTWSAWVKVSALKPNAVIYSRRDNGKAFIVGSDSGIPYVEVSTGSGMVRSANTNKGAAVQVNTWHHLAVVADGGKLTIYLDGELYSTLLARVPALNSAAMLGGDAGLAGSNTPGDAGIAGEIDELEISKIARPVGFVKLAAIGQSGDKAGKLLAFGPEEAPTNIFSGLSNGYIGIIVRSLTPDGWAVICLLMVMAAISWYVMITKAGYLNAAAKGNLLFMKEWRHLANDLTSLDNGDGESMKSLGGRVDKKAERAMRSSGVYRIYHIGVEEIRHRLAADRGVGTKLLKARSIQAIRASLDGGLVRETQRLNSGMVLLTIAISGGPFLGLLGTVVGVMITFAAVAQAGDVNVNAIAPGIAAALLATVAGLAVAIPSLFGYNYLLTRVKDATSDMHVFVDEFVSKMAEFYGGKTE